MPSTPPSTTNEKTIKPSSTTPSTSASPARPPPPRRQLVQPEFVTSEGGSGPFRAFNFELYAVSLWEKKTRKDKSISIERKTFRLTKKKRKKKTKTKTLPLSLQKPTGAVRALSFAGTLALGGVLLYFWNQNEKQQKLFRNEEEEARERRW